MSVEVEDGGRDAMVTLADGKSVPASCVIGGGRSSAWVIGKVEKTSALGLCC